MVYKTFEGCTPKQNPRVSLDFLTDIVQFSSRIIRLVINILYVYRFITAINSLRLRGQSNEDDEDNGISKIRAPYMCATRHHLSVEPDVLELHKELRRLMYRFKLEVRFIAHTIQHYPNLLFQTVPLLESGVRKLQCSLDDLEMAATFDGKSEIQSNQACHTKKSFSRNQSSYGKKERHQDKLDKTNARDMTDDFVCGDITSQKKYKNNNMSSISPEKLPTYQTESLSSDTSNKQSKRPRKLIPIISEGDSSSDTAHSLPHESGKARRLEADEEQVYLIARNIHLSLHTLLINAKLIHLTTKDGLKAGISTLLFPFIYDIGKKFCLSFYYLQLLSKYISYRAAQTQNRPVPPLTDFRVNLYPVNRNVIIEANQFLVDNFARTVKKRSVRFNVAAQQCLPPSVLTRRFSNIENAIEKRDLPRYR